MLKEILAEEESVAAEREAEAARIGATLLGMPIRELPSLRSPVCVSPEHTVEEAVQLMNESHVGCVLVVAESRVVGILTERDVLRKVVGAGRSAGSMTVSATMTPDPECLRPEDRVRFALHKMGVGGFRRVPLVDDAGGPAGVVSIRNIVEVMVDMYRREVLNLPPRADQAYGQREGA